VATPQQEPETSRLVREEAAEESPVAASQKPEMSPVQEIPVAASQEPVVFRERSRSRKECPVANPQENVRMTRISRPSRDVEAPPGRKDFRASFFPVTGCGTWTRKMKDHAFKSHLSHFFKLPVRVTGVDPVLFCQLGEALGMVGRFACGPGSGANELMSSVNSRIRFPLLCTIPTECTLAMREVDIAMGWELVVSPN